jgi:Family of unknown function (DUF6088)
LRNLAIATRLTRRFSVWRSRAGLRRIDRGLYDKPVLNPLTKRPTTPDYRAVVDAIARRERLRMLVDGMTAANDLRLTDAVPARVVIHTDARRRKVQLGQQNIELTSSPA